MPLMQNNGESIMKQTVALIASASLAALAAPAMAQSADESEFEGPYIGAVAGYDTVRAGSDVDLDNQPNNDQSIEGIGYGVVAGYDKDFGSVVLGLEGEYLESTADTDFDNGDFEGFGFGNVAANRDLYVGLRAGFKVAPRTLVYAKGGYTNAKFDIRSNDGTVETTDDIDADGYRIGAGVEQKVGSNAFARLEYRYSKYSEAEIDMEGNLPDSSRFDIDTDRHQVMASLGWRF